jgi:hypothetical protein
VDVSTSMECFLLGQSPPWSLVVPCQCIVCIPLLVGFPPGPRLVRHWLSPSPSLCVECLCVCVRVCVCACVCMCVCVCVCDPDSFVVLGKYLEAAAKARTSNALTALMSIKVEQVSQAGWGMGGGDEGSTETGRVLRQWLRSSSLLCALFAQTCLNALAALLAMRGFFFPA